MRDTILFYSDEHLRQTGSFPPFNRIAESGLTLELENILRGFKWIAQRIRDISPRAVFGLGDAFHSIDLISSMTLHAAGLGFGYLAEACEEVKAQHFRIPGNHDLYSERFCITPLRSLGRFFTLIDQPGTIDLNGFRIRAVPYTSDRQKAYLDLVEAQTGTNLIVTHLEFNGAEYENGEVVQGEIDSNLAVRCISGHMHVPCDTGNVSYVGSLVQHRFSRRNLAGVGGILLFDIDSTRIERCPNPASVHYVKAFTIAEAREFDPAQVVVQLITELPREEIERELEGYQIHYVRRVDVSSDETIRKQYDGIGSIEPELMLRAFIEQDNPEALGAFDSVIGGQR